MKAKKNDKSSQRFQEAQRWLPLERMVRRVQKDEKPSNDIENRADRPLEVGRTTTRSNSTARRPRRCRPRLSRLVAPLREAFASLGPAPLRNQPGQAGRTPGEPRTEKTKCQAHTCRKPTARMRTISIRLHKKLLRHGPLFDDQDSTTISITGSPYKKAVKMASDFGNIFA
jgi:hypothetical protein